MQREDTDEPNSAVLSPNSNPKITPMNKKETVMKKRLSTLILALVLSFSISAPAFASEEKVSEKSLINNCCVWSELYQNGSQYKTSSWIQARSGNIPAGSVQVQAVMYGSRGEVRTSSLSMLTSAQGFFVADTPYRSVLKGSIYSQGILYFKDSTGAFTIHQTQSAVASNLPQTAATEEIDPIRVNAKGETYGSLLMAKTAAEYPDLIFAVGTEGQSGYLRREEFLAPDDRCGDVTYGGKHIALYDLEGQRIGNFSLAFSHPDTAEKDIKAVRSQLAAGSVEELRLMALADKFLVNGDYPVNAKGQTYGPNLLRDLLGYSPDLTPAVNDDGLAGYVRSVKEIPISAEEMEILSAATSEPLYDKDGNVIGIFEWHSAEPVQVVGRTVSEAREELANGLQSG